MREESPEFGLFGREDALQAVSDLMEQGGGAVVTGDPGAGKSSLMKAAAQLAQRRGRRVLSVAPTQFERGLPFAGLAELLGQFPEGADTGLPGPQQRALAVALHSAEPAEGGADALAVPLGVRGLLKRLCESEPVALLIDDLQWLDQASVGGLGFAIRGMSAGPHRLSVLIATRPDPGTGADLIRSLPEPRHELLLRPLEDWAIGLMLRTRLGPRWTPPVSAGVAKASGGNPFLALMIARAMEADVTRWRGSVFPVPPSLAELLRERVARLPQDPRDVLLLVSAAGRLTVAQLRSAVEEARLMSALEAAADEEVANVDAESVVVFTHPMLASAIYDVAAPADRRRAHRILAETLQDPVERARHRSRSITVPDEVVARDLEEAAEISRRRGAPHVAGELLERAALATPSGPGSGALRRWLLAVRSYTSAGDRVAARAALDKGSPLATGPEQQAQILAWRARQADDYSTAVSLAEQALRLAPEGSEVRAESLNTLGGVLRTQGRGKDALRVIQDAITAAAAVGRLDVQFEALNERLAAESLWGFGRREQTLRDIQRLADVSPPDVYRARLAWTRGFFAPWNDEKSESYVREAITWAIDVGQYSDLSYLYIGLVFILIRASRVRDAQTALDDADRSGAWWSSFQEAMSRTLVNAYAGNLDVAREAAQAGMELPVIPTSPYWRGGFLAQLGFIENSGRNWQAALEVLRELADVVEHTGMVDLEQLLWGVDYADAALQAGATQDVEVAISVLRRQGAAGRPEATVAAKRCQALLMAAQGGADDAMRQLREIVDQPGIECPFEAARSRLALGQVCRRAGYKGMAIEELNAAAAAFEDLGIPRWAERARDEASRVGLHPSTSQLTATERRVAELVGSGRSNQETAAELFMSVKTVEANLTRIYRKLSVRSRTELAVRMGSLDSQLIEIMFPF